MDWSAPSGWPVMEGHMVGSAIQYAAPSPAHPPCYATRGSMQGAALVPSCQSKQALLLDLLR
jgi:hypothetical protein